MLYQLSYFRSFHETAEVATSRNFMNLWEVVDSNHRTLRERIYSPPQLPLCDPPKFAFQYFKAPLSR